MIQYCRENRIEFNEFKEGRTPQKIRGWHKMNKITATANGSSIMEKSSYLDNKGMCYPLLDEMDYLLSLNGDTINEEILRLRKILVDPKHVQYSINGEEELKRIAENNRSLLIEVRKRLETKGKACIGDNNLDRMCEKYNDMIPAMKRKHENLIKKERRILKTVGLGNKSEYIDEKMKNGRSPSGNSETMQEEL